MHSLLFAVLFFSAGRLPQPRTLDGTWIEPSPGRMAFDGSLHFTAQVYTPETVLAGRLILEYDSARYAFFPQKEANPDGFFLAVEGATAAALPFPFTDVTYWWEADLQSGSVLVSAAQTFFYADDRFEWNNLPRNILNLFWVEGGPEAADETADLALLALGSISAELETPIPPRLTIVRYARMADFQAALGGRIHGWEGAVSSPGGATVILAAAPGAEGRPALAILLPHEIAHVLMGARWGAGYARIPKWLMEGTAAGYEMEPRPDLEAQLREAFADGSIIPIHSLCRVFPAEENPAMLAYAESKSFVAFLKQQYGIAAVRNALGSYAEGAECGLGIQTVAGKSLPDLESDWRDTFSDDNPFLSASWLLVIAGVVLLAGVLGIRWWVRRGRAKKMMERPGAE